MQDSSTGLDKIIRIEEVESASGLSRSTIERLLKKRQFPAPVRLSQNAKGWFLSQIKAWQESLVPVGPKPEPEAEERGSAPCATARSPRDDRRAARARR